MDRERSISKVCTGLECGGHSIGQRASTGRGLSGDRDQLCRLHRLYQSDRRGLLDENMGVGSADSEARDASDSRGLASGPWGELGGDLHRPTTQRERGIQLLEV